MIVVSHAALLLGCQRAYLVESCRLTCLVSRAPLAARRLH
jgi:hypothetical protein